MSTMARFQPVIQAPFDVRLMNATSALLLAAVLLATLMAGLWWLLRNPAFAIQRIVVQGQTAHNDAASLRASVLPHLKGNFFTLNMAQTQAAFQSAPWVEHALVRRRWPGLLDVALREYQPFARWGASGTRMIDVNGQLFDTGSSNRNDQQAASLPTLIGPDSQSAAVLAMYGKLEPLVAPLHARLAVLQLQGRGSWRAVLVGDPPFPESAAGAALDALIELGSGAPDELAARLQSFVATVPQVAARHQRNVADVETVGLDYPNGYTLRLRGVTTTDGPNAAVSTATQPALSHDAATKVKH